MSHQNTDALGTAIAVHRSGSGSTADAEDRSSSSGASTIAVIKEGWVRKRGHVIHSWRRRYFVLTSDSQLRYYENDAVDTAKPIVEWPEPRGQVLLTTNTYVGDNAKDSPDNHGFIVQHRSTNTVLMMRAHSREELAEWLDALRGVVVRSRHGPSTGPLFANSSKSHSSGEGGSSATGGGSTAVDGRRGGNRLSTRSLTSSPLSVQSVDLDAENVARSVKLLADANGSYISGQDRALLVNNVNVMLKSWERQDGDIFKQMTTNDFHMDIPAYGMDVLGIDNVLAAMHSLQKLGVHAASTHTVRALSPSSAEVHCYGHVFTRSTGLVYEHVELLSRWVRNGDKWLCEYYRQDSTYRQGADQWRAWTPRTLSLPSGVAVSFVDAKDTSDTFNTGNGVAGSASGNPPLVCVHGVGESLFAFADVVPKLLADSSHSHVDRAILISLPGFGDSGIPDAAAFAYHTPQETYSEIVCQVLASLPAMDRGKDRCRLMAHGALGYAVCLHLATVENPERFGERLVLAHPNGSWTESAERGMPPGDASHRPLLSLLETHKWTTARFTNAMSEVMQVPSSACAPVVMNALAGLAESNAVLAAEFAGEVLLLGADVADSGSDGGGTACVTTASFPNAKRVCAVTDVGGTTVGGVQATSVEEALDEPCPMPNRLSCLWTDAGACASHVAEFLSQQSGETGTVPVTVLRHAGKEADVNSFLVMNSTHIVVIDCLRNVPEAHDLAERVRGTGREVQAILVSHGHPDHWVGLGVLHEAFPGAAVYVAREEIVQDIAQFADAMDPEPTMRCKSSSNPDGFDFHGIIEVLQGPSPVIKLQGADGGEIELCANYPPTEAMHMTTFFCPQANTLFASDLVYHGVHCWMGMGVEREHIANWVRTLDNLADQYKSRRPFVMPGHGACGGLDLLTRTKKYLQDFLLVCDTSGSNAQAKQSMVERFPHHTQDNFLLDFSIDNHGPDSKPAR